MKLLSSNLNIGQKTAIFLIQAYQKTLSPDHGFLKPLFPYGICRFQLTCSEFTIVQIQKKGLTKGLVSGLVRIASCNPFVGSRNYNSGS